MRDMGALKDRLVFFVGVNTGYVTEGLPDDRYVEFYRRRASPGLYCGIIGNVVIPSGYGSNPSTPMLTKDNIWGKIATEIKGGGTLPGIQLATTWPNYHGSRGFVGTNHQEIILTSRRVVTSLGRSVALGIIAALSRGADIAIDHGFRHLQVHGAHGYLLNLLIDQRINPFADEVVEKLSEAASNWISNGVEASLRVSLRTGARDFDANGGDEFIDKVVSTPFTYIDLSSGFYNIDKRLIYPSTPAHLEARLIETMSVALRHQHRSFIYSGKAMSSIGRVIANNVHIGIGRDLIADPDFLDGRIEGRGCKNRNKCHYFSRGLQSLTCALWDQTD